MTAILTSNRAAPRQVAELLFSGSLMFPADYFGVSAWYVPWSEPYTSNMLDPSTYSINRYCTVYGAQNNNTQWATCNPSPGTFVWTDMDTWVNYHYGRGTDVLAQVGGWCPTWASARPAEQHASFAACPTEPADMADFVAWLVAVGYRYNGKVKYWLMPNEPSFAAGSEFTGTAAKYAEMTRLASQVLKAINPENKIVGPEISNISAGNVDTRLVPFLTASAAGYDAGYGTGAGTTGKDWIDILGVHDYFDGYDTSGDPVGNMARWPYLKSVLSSHGLSAMPIWVTEIMMIQPVGAPEVELYKYLMREALVSRINGAARMIWFDLGGSAKPWLQADERGRQARAYWSQLRDICYGSTITDVARMTDESIRVTRADGKVFFV